MDAGSAPTDDAPRAASHRPGPRLAPPPPAYAPPAQARPYISLYLPVSPCISLHLPVSPYISCWLRLLRERRALAAAHAAALAAGSSGGGSGGGKGGGEGSGKGARRADEARRRRAHAQPRGSGGAKAARPTLGEALSPAEGEQLGRALAQHASIFSWARGDVLLIDNARVLHDGEPLTLTPKPEP